MNRIIVTCFGIALTLPPAYAVSACSSSSSKASSTSTWCGPATQSPTTITASTSPCTTASSPRPPLAASMPSDSCETCTPRCGATKISMPGEGTWYAEYDLPSGACTQDGETCDMNAFDQVSQCGNGTVAASNVTGYRCSCVDKLWSCEITSEGAGGGGASCPRDGGAD